MSDYQQWVQMVVLGFDATMAPELKAPVLDPVWFLLRQLHFGEFQHDGGSSPVDIEVTFAQAQPSRMQAAAGGQAPVEIRLGRSPLEPLVEQEAVPGDGLENLRMRAEQGLRLQRLLRTAGLAAQADTWATRGRFAPPAAAVLDDETRDWYDTMAGRIPDARLIGGQIAQIVAGQDTSTVLAPGELDVLKAWQAGTGIWEHSARGQGNWDPEQLEYRLSVGAVVGDDEVVLDVPEYAEGTLDWYDFDVGSVSLGLTGQTGFVHVHRLPVPLQYVGMPNDRFWSFEDPGVDFDLLQLFTGSERLPSTAALMALEFALSYGDDWCQVPLPLPAHALCQVQSVVITDCFGDTVSAQRPAGRWNLFRPDEPLAPDGLSTVFVDAAPNLVVDGEPLEEVHFLRDEQANLGWAIETQVPRPLGGSKAPAPPSDALRPTDETGTSWTMSPVTLPRNWFPLVPVADDFGRLAVGTLWTARDARPAGRLLGELLPNKRLHDYQVPSEGVQVTRSWRAARAIDGSLHFWIGRAKIPRQTELAPDLRFDVVDP
jgi:hypothetical protein